MRKPISEQVLVVTGASSGIGLATARLAAERGARVAISGRDAAVLEQVARRIDPSLERVTWAEGDVGDPEDVEALAAAAEGRWGRIDTWVNNAGVSIYGRLEDVALEDHRRLFETNFWGTLHGALAALPRLRRSRGTLINIGSILGELTLPLQGSYCASKHAVKALTEALRMELEMAGDPVAVSLIEPSGIETPYPDHARSTLEVAPRNPSPTYTPEAVAEAILRCAVRPVPHRIVGDAGRMYVAAAKVAPRLTERVLERTMGRLQRSDRPPHTDDGLYTPAGAGRERGRGEGLVLAHADTLSRAARGAGFLLLIGAGIATASRLRRWRG